MPRIPLLAALLLLAASPAAAQSWTDATATTIGTTAQWSNKVELADLDGDGWIDVLFANGGDYSEAGAPEPQRIFRNRGAWDGAPPYLEEVTDGWLGAGAVRLSRVLKARDLDGDGDLDLFAGGAHGTDSALWRNDGDGAFTDVSATALPAGALSLGDAEAGDVDGDGDLDLVLADWGGPPFEVDGGRTRLWRNDGDGVFTDDTAASMPDVLIGMSWDLELVDVDDDGDLDALVSCKLCDGGRLFRNDGAGVFADDTDGNLPQHANNYEYEPMDIDGDGDLDLATINDGAGLRESLLVNDGAGRFTDETATRLPGAVNAGEDDNVVVFLDVDADGDADYLIGSLSGADRLLVNDGAGVFSLDDTVTPVITPGTLGLAAADLDHDGRLDLVDAQGEVASPDKVYLAAAANAVDDAPPSVAVIEGATEGDLAVVARVHDRKSPGLPQDWQRVTLVIVSSGSSDETEMTWRGEYLWVASLPGGDPDLRYQVCATDAAGNAACSAERGLDDPPDAGAGPDASGPGEEHEGGCGCGATGSPDGAILLLVALIVVRRQYRRRPVRCIDRPR